MRVCVRRALIAFDPRSRHPCSIAHCSARAANGGSYPAAAGSSRKAEAWTVGLRWYLTGNVWYTVNFERTIFDGNSKGPRRAENGLAFRTQLYF